MEKMDYDADNDMDLVIGSFTKSPAPTPSDVQKEWRIQHINIGVLENNSN